MCGVLGFYHELRTLATLKTQLFLWGSSNPTLNCFQVPLRLSVRGLGCALQGLESLGFRMSDLGFCFCLGIKPQTPKPLIYGAISDAALEILNPMVTRV